MSGRRIGPYTVVRLIGRGSVGTVYEALQDNPRRTVALKVLRGGMATETARHRFQWEAEALGRLDHPFVGHIHAAGTAELEDGPRPYIAMELVRGLPVDEWAAENGPDLRARLELLVRIGEGLSHAHARGVIHRDVKPANVLVDAAGDPRIVDFGIARALGGDERATTLRTAEGQLVGTLQFMSPEQASGEADAVDARSDVYALGVMAYELLSGRPPYDLEGETLPRALQRITEEEPPRLGTFDRELRGDIATIVATALEKDRERRYQSMAELVADLRRHLDDRPITARRTSTREQVTKFVRRHRAVAAGLTVGAFLLVLGLAAMVVGLLEARASADLAQRRVVEAAAARDAAQESRRTTSAALADATKAQADVERARSAAEQARNDVAQSLREAEAVSSFITDALRGVPREAWEDDVLVSEILDAAELRLADDFDDVPRAAAKLHRTLAWAYGSVGRSGKTLGHAQRAWELFRETDGPVGAETMKAQQELASRLMDADRRDEASALLAEVEAHWFEQQGPESRNALSAAFLRGRLLRSQEDHAAAEAVLAPATERASAAFGDDDDLTCKLRLELAIVIADQRRLDEAEPLMRTVAESHRRRHGVDSAETLRVEKSLANLLAGRGRASESLELFERVLDRYTHTLGPDNPHTAMVLADLGSLYGRMGRYDEAYRTLTDAAERMARGFGPRNSRTLAMRHRVGRILERQARYEEAAATLLEVIDGSREIGTERSLVSLSAIGLLGQVRLGQGRREEARELLRASIDGLRAEHGLHALEMGQMLVNLASIEQGLGRWEEARALIEDARDLFRRIHGPDSMDEMRVRCLLANLHRQRGDLGEAEALLLSVFEPMRAALGSQHPDLAISLGHLGKLRVEQERYEEAHSILSVVIAELLRHFPAGHDMVLAYRQDLVDALVGLDRLDEAVDELEAIRRLAVADYGEASPAALTATERLARGLTISDRLDEGIQLVARFLETLRSQGSPEDDVLRMEIALAELEGANDVAHAEALLARAIASWGEGAPATKVARTVLDAAVGGHSSAAAAVLE